jgi:glycerol kinase
MSGYILAIDQGTTSTRSMIFDHEMHIVGVAQQEFTQHFPDSGWVEHDADEIWQSVLATIEKALSAAKIKIGDVTAIGITNQRETVVVWDRQSGSIPIFQAPSSPGS